jgi:thiosulfate dehydrogenase
MRAFPAVVIGAVVLALAVAALQPRAQGGEPIEVKLCDNKTTTTIPADAPRTHDNGQAVANSLMAQWREANPNSDWVEEEKATHAVVEPADNSALIGQGQGATYGLITKQDVLVWQNETYKTVIEGSLIFHSGDRLKSQIAVSCDMCHPHAANTHPETYPKFQPQLGRVALLRDMINWCIEHPVRGQVLAPDSAEMRALESFIIAQRKGTPLDYGKR